MKVAVAGAGKVGRFLAEDLAQNGHEVQLLDSNADLVADLAAASRASSYVTADACEVTSLKAAHFDEMDVVVATTGDDEDNLVISQLAKQEFAVPRVLARVNHPKNHWLFNEMWGVDVAVSTPQLLAGSRRRGRLGRDARPPAAVRRRPHPPHGSDPERRLAGDRLRVRGGQPAPRGGRRSARA